MSNPNPKFSVARIHNQTNALRKREGRDTHPWTLLCICGDEEEKRENERERREIFFCLPKKGTGQATWLFFFGFFIFCH